MSISSEISRISSAKADIKTAIAGKGVTVPGTAKIDDLADYIDQIAQGGGKAYQASIDVGTSTSTSYIDAGLELTVAKAGIYKVSWEGFRTTTSGTAGSQMYKNGTAYGTPNTTFPSLSSYAQINILEHVSLSAGDVIKIYARSRGSGYAMFVGGLLIEEE